MVDIKKNYITKNGLFIGKLLDLSTFIHQVSIVNAKYLAAISYSPHIKELCFDEKGHCIGIFDNKQPWQENRDTSYDLSEVQLIDVSMYNEYRMKARYVYALGETIAKLHELHDSIIRDINERDINLPNQQICH